MDVLYDYFEESLTLYSLETKLIIADCDDVREDIVLHPKEMKKVWGYAKNEFGHPIENQVVTLCLPGYIRGRLHYQPVDSVITDKNGFFQFLRPIAELDKGFEISC